MASVSVFGLGYVGCVSAACLAREGHLVVGVDVSTSKVDMINRGLSTIVEEGIADLVRDMRATGRLRATASVAEAIAESTISLVAVGTPSRRNGSIDLRYIERVAEEIGEALATKADFHVVVIRSTVMPGTIHGTVIPAIERTSGKRHKTHFAVCSNPEFLREGTSIRDFYDPPFTLVGSDVPEAAAAVTELYAGVKAPTHVVEVRVAEMAKYACNCFHGLKVGFANEIGNICKALGVDSHEVMRIFCEDRKLNISSAYLKPGFAFGGSCLPKDLRAIVHRARMEDVQTSILSAVLESNRAQIERAFQMISATGARRIGVLGLAFKAGTDDLRESPMVTLIEMLLGRGFDVRIFDSQVRTASIVGANREFVEREIPHIWSLMAESLDGVYQHAETIVVGNSSPEFRELTGAKDGTFVIDLAKVLVVPEQVGSYEGIAW